jgi:hypothetical protein
MSAFEELIALAPPPVAPSGAPFDWAAAEARLGTALPADWKAYCDAYGHGGFDNGWGWYPLTPFAPDAEDDLVAGHWRDLLADAEPDRRLVPEPGGVLPFLYSELKHVFWWRTGGPPDAWPVLVQGDFGWHDELELTATELLLGVLRGELLGGEEDGVRAVTFFARGSRVAGPHRPFVIAGSGVEAGRSFVTLDLGGALGGARGARLEELFAALDPAVRGAILRAEAHRSEEVLFVRSQADVEPVSAAVQAWADRVSGWEG